MGFQSDATKAERAAAAGRPNDVEKPSPESYKDTLTLLARAVELDDWNYGSWHAYALMNYKLTQLAEVSWEGQKAGKGGGGRVKRG